MTRSVPAAPLVTAARIKTVTGSTTRWVVLAPALNIIDRDGVCCGWDGTGCRLASSPS
jgi:hypothetical protein